MTFNFKNMWGGNAWGIDNHSYDRWFDGSEAAVDKKVRVGNKVDFLYDSKGTFIKEFSHGNGNRNSFIEGQSSPIDILTLNTLQVNNEIYAELPKSWDRTYSLLLIASNFQVVIENDNRKIMDTKGYAGKPYGDIQFVSISKKMLEFGIKKQGNLNNIIIAYAHELHHVFQRTDRRLKSLQHDDKHFEREFWAYQFSLFPNTTSVLGASNFRVGITSILPTPTEGQRAQWVFRAIEAINHLTTEQVNAVYYKEHIDRDYQERDRFSSLGIDFNCQSIDAFNEKNEDVIIELDN